MLEAIHRALYGMYFERDVLRGRRVLPDGVHAGSRIDQGARRQLLGSHTETHGSPDGEQREKANRHAVVPGGRNSGEDGGRR